MFIWKDFFESYLCFSVSGHFSQDLPSYGKYRWDATIITVMAGTEQGRCIY